MSVTLPYSFQSGTPADADEVNAQFDVLYNWINNTAKHKDTVNPFTTLPSLPVNPTTANHLTRVAYARLSPYIVVGESDDKVFGTYTPPANDNTNAWKFEAGYKDVSLTNGTGVLTLVTGFATCLFLAFVSVSDLSAAGNGERAHVVTSTGLDRFTVRCGNTTRTERFTYICVGF